MKHPWKRLVSLLLAVLLVLSVAAVAEDEVVVDESLDLAQTNNVTVEDVEETPEVLGEDIVLDLGLLSQDESAEASPSEAAPEAPQAASETAVAVNATEQAVANAIPSKVTIGVKEKYTIDTSSLSGKLTFKSSNASIATVSKKGVVTGKKAGTAKITITPKKGKKKTITVTVKNAPDKVTLNKEDASLKIGKTLQLKAKLPNKTASYKMTWTSSKKKVATVSSTGKVTALAAGTATITVKTFNGKKASCKVTVKQDDNQFSVDRASISLYPEETETVVVTYRGADEYIHYSIADPNIVDCKWDENWDGDDIKLYITGLKSGTTTVTVYDDSKNSSTNIKVTVKNPFSVDRSSISIDGGDTYTVVVTYRGSNDIAFSIDLPDIVDCEWDEDWDGDDTNLYITGLDTGTAIVTVYDEETYDSVKIKVTVSGEGIWE